MLTAEPADVEIGDFGFAQGGRGPEAPVIRDKNLTCARGQCKLPR